MLDEIDRKLVRLLADRGRLSHEQLAQEVHLSRPAVHERVKRLEARGIIRGYHARIDWGALGQPITAFIWVASRAQSDQTAARLLELTTEEATIEECYGVTGEWCLFLKARVTTPRALKELIDRVYTVPGVYNTMTILSLASYHDACLDPAAPRDG